MDWTKQGPPILVLIESLDKAKQLAMENASTHFLGGEGLAAGIQSFKNLDNGLVVFVAEVGIIMLRVWPDNDRMDNGINERPLIGRV
ncbi:hypothetical protein D3C80_1196140 [compost metagenome]